jgi:hypothetical protein
VISCRDVESVTYTTPAKVYLQRVSPVRGHGNPAVRVPCLTAACRSRTPIFRSSRLCRPCSLVSTVTRLVRCDVAATGLPTTSFAIPQPLRQTTASFSLWEEGESLVVGFVSSCHGLMRRCNRVKPLHHPLKLLDQRATPGRRDSTRETHHTLKGHERPRKARRGAHIIRVVRQARARTVRGVAVTCRRSPTSAPLKSTPCDAALYALRWERAREVVCPHNAPHSTPFVLSSPCYSNHHGQKVRVSTGAEPCGAVGIPQAW